jgi:DNA-binding response OmpR family regulator
MLVVDDDPAILEFLQMALEDANYDVMTAAHGAAALERVRKRSPGLILLDALMDVMTGKEFAEAYRAMPVDHAPIVVLSAVRDIKKEATAIGGDAYLAKPFELADLLNVVKRYLP